MIIGYDEVRNSGSDKSGSHNIVVGIYNNYTSFGGVVNGYYNTISGEYSSVCGGNTNTASGWDASVLGGQYNNAGGNSSAISGGQSNITSGTWTAIGGGQNKTAITEYYYSNGSYSNLTDKPITITQEQANAIVNNTSNIISLQTRATDLETKTASMSIETVNGQPTVRFTGVNVQIVSGSGITNGIVNGKGNLIIGYDEARPIGVSDKRGSHNIVVGLHHNYTSFGGLVLGNYNTISGEYSSVNGGHNNTAAGNSSSVSGGNYNSANSFGSSVSGGDGNTASGLFSSISGGENNNSTGECSSVSGGYNNQSAGDYNSITGGTGNLTSSSYATISGGKDRRIYDNYDWVGGTYWADY